MPTIPTVSVDDYVDRLVCEAPPLTREQRDRLTVLLRPSPGDSTGERDAA